MHTDPATQSSNDPRFDQHWRDDRGFLLGMASRMLGDATEAEDVLQEAFDRFSRVDIDDLDDSRAWLAVVVRRLCLDRIRSARSRRESASGAVLADRTDTSGPDRRAVPSTDPADRVTLDDQVQQALAVVLDRLSPAERTSFVLHDVFGFPFDAVAEIVGRTPLACRQLASRARRSIREGAPPSRPAPATARHHALAERFIAACAGGDIGELMEALDPEVAGEATLLGHGPLVELRGRPEVAQRLLSFFGPSTESVLVPLAVERRPGLLAFTHGRLAAVISLDVVDGLVHHIKTWVTSPR